MATSGKVVAAAVLLLLVAASTFVPASASTLTVFSGPGCAGRTMDVNGCGCFATKGFNGGYHFVFTEGQKATLYTGYKCNGKAEALKKETRRCNKNNFHSIYMAC